MKRTTTLVVFLIWLIPCPFSSLHSAPVADLVVEAEGFGTSEQDALLSAKREAVETGIGTVLISQTEVRNYQLQQDVILTKTLGAVKQLKVLQSEKQSDHIHRVRIEAVVSLASIKADLAALKILLESMDRPRMMVIIQEDGGREAEGAIIDYLTAKEFNLIDPAIVAAAMRQNPAQIQQAASGDPDAAAKIGASHGAEYIIVGRAVKSTGRHSLLEEAEMVSGQATITAKVIDCSTAAIIASKQAHSAAAHISEDVARTMASRKAGTKLMDEALFEAILASFQDMLNNGLSLDVRILAVPSYQAQKSIRQKLAETPKVVSVHKRSYGNGQLHLTVLFKGTADSFCDAIDGKSLAGRISSVTAVSGSRIRIQLQ